MKDTGIERYSPDVIEMRNRKPGRNQPCPCDSGIKYKKCCGKL
jgi:preprotein translocase subunit SecA